MSTLLSSRERLLAALACEPVTPVPFALMSFRIQRDRCHTWYEVAERELEMGLDAVLFVPPAERHDRPEHPDLRGIPVRIPPDVTTREWSEASADPSYPILHKEYSTPAGPLHTAVQKTEDWTHGDHIPFLDDYQIARAREFLVKTGADLPRVRNLLAAPTARDIAAFRETAAEALAFTRKHNILAAGGWGVGADMAGWLVGLQNLILLATDAPDMLQELLALIAEWNRQRMAVVLDAGIDLYIRRGWYESCALWSPRLYRRFILPHLIQDVQLAHQAGVKFGYIMTTGTTPLLDMLQESGIDALIGVDPAPTSGNNLRLLRERLCGKVCFWGGVNADHTVELGTAEEVRAATRHALNTLGPDGLILSPVDNLTQDTPRTWANLQVMIETWREQLNLTH